MTRIKKWKIKRTKVYVLYEFDHEGKTYEKKASFPVKHFEEISKDSLLPCIRGAAARERAKLRLGKRKISALTGIAMTEDAKEKETEEEIEE